MSDHIKNYRSINEIIEDINKEYAFGFLETYKLAVQIQRNEILEYYFKIRPKTELGMFD